MKKDAKVFGIGFHKTATSSLGAALSELGYDVCGRVGGGREDISEAALELALSHVDHHDAFQDNPWPVIYRELDRHYPGSKFILTTRPTSRWITSVVKHFGGRSTAMREWIYGAGNPKGHEEIYVKRYERHNREVRAFFNDRPDDFLELSITAGEGWEKLCPFLGCAVPGKAFQNKNRGTTRILRRYYQRMPSWLQMLARTLRNTVPR